MGAVRHAHHRPTPHPDHPALPSDAVIHHNPEVLAKIQAYEDQTTDKPKVKGYAISPNPSRDGDWVRDADAIIYWWYEDQPNTITEANASTFGA